MMKEKGRVDEDKTEPKFVDRRAAGRGGSRLAPLEHKNSTRAPPKKRTKRMWKRNEDRALISCMVELYHEGAFNAPSGFSTGYFQTVEKLLRDKLVNTDLKASPHIESRIKALRNEWSTFYDMIYGSCTSEFGWDYERKVVLADDKVWNAYLKSHEKAEPYRTKSLWYFEDFTMIYGKDRATGKDAQGIEDVLEEIYEQGSKEEHETESAHESDGSTIITDGGSTRVDVLSKKRKDKSNSIESSTAESMLNAARMLGNDMKEIGKEISRSIGVELTIQQKAEELYEVLKEVEGLTRKEMFAALRKIPNHPTQMLVFFNLPMEERSEWVKDFLNNTA